MTPALQRFDPATGLWELLSPGPIPVHGMASARIGDSIYFFGGSVAAASGIGSDLIQRYVCAEAPPPVTVLTPRPRGGAPRPVSRATSFVAIARAATG